MMPKKSFNPTQEQCEFCFELMRRLDQEVHYHPTVAYGRVTNYTQMQQDIIRLRRELMKLSKMLGDWGYEE